MGWPFFLEMYFRPTLYAFGIGVLFPWAKLLLWRFKSGSWPSVPILKLMNESLACSFRLGSYTFLILLIIGFIGSILFSVWAIAIALVA